MPSLSRQARAPALRAAAHEVGPLHTAITARPPNGRALRRPAGPCDSSRRPSSLTKKSGGRSTADNACPVRQKLPLPIVARARSSPCQSEGRGQASVSPFLRRPTDRTERPTATTRRYAGPGSTTVRIKKLPASFGLQKVGLPDHRGHCERCRETPVSGFPRHRVARVTGINPHSQRGRLAFLATLPRWSKGSLPSSVPPAFLY